MGPNSSLNSLRRRKSCWNDSSRSAEGIFKLTSNLSSSWITDGIDLSLITPSTKTMDPTENASSTLSKSERKKLIKKFVFGWSYLTNFLGQARKRERKFTSRWWKIESNREVWISSMFQYGLEDSSAQINLLQKWQSSWLLVEAPLRRSVSERYGMMCFSKDTSEGDELEGTSRTGERGSTEVGYCPNNWCNLSNIQVEHQ